MQLVTRWLNVRCEGVFSPGEGPQPVLTRIWRLGRPATSLYDASNATSSLPTWASTGNAIGATSHRCASYAGTGITGIASVDKGFHSDWPNSVKGLRRVGRKSWVGQAGRAGGSRIGSSCGRGSNPRAGGGEPLGTRKRAVPGGCHGDPRRAPHPCQVETSLGTIYPTTRRVITGGVRSQFHRDSSWPPPSRATVCTV